MKYTILKLTADSEKISMERWDLDTNIHVCGWLTVDRGGFKAFLSLSCFESTFLQIIAKSFQVLKAKYIFGVLCPIIFMFHT